MRTGGERREGGAGVAEVDSGAMSEAVRGEMKVAAR